MEETRTGGGREFVFSVIWAAALLFIGQMITNALPDYKVIGTIITILIFCVLGFFVLTRYAAVYTYTFKDDRLRVNRRIGHRNKEIDFAVSQVRSVTRHRPGNAPKGARIMRASVFSEKRSWYIVYEENGVNRMLVCEISKNMAEKLISRTKQLKK